MAPDLPAACLLVELDPVEEQILTSSRRPIVLLRRRRGAPVAESAAGNNRFLGVMLPYTPIHYLLCDYLGAPFVLTSGNVSDEPIAYADDDAFKRLAPIADSLLTHNRPIHIRTDDSVVRVLRRREVPVRRSRGYAPQPLRLSSSVRRPILGCGAELKNTFWLAKEQYAFLSHHIGDLENYETLRAFTEGIAHFCRLFDVNPEVVAYDLHPEYLSTKYALERDGVELLRVQHHHAHLASCLADNGYQEPVIGVAFDGLGYGTDGTMWGGEFLVGDLIDFERVGHFETVAMPWGAAAIKQPWRMAAAYLDALFGDSVPDNLEVVRRNQRHWKQIVRMARAKLNSPATSSVGRLFDAVAAILGVRDAVNYEGQAAIELEQQSAVSERSAYQVSLGGNEACVVRGTEIVQSVIEDLRSGSPIDVVAARFHNTLAEVIVNVCNLLRAARGLSVVALTGGVFQNELLLTRTVSGLEKHRFRVLTHSRVPTNDGGISLGQVAIVGARDRHWAAVRQGPEKLCDGPGLERAISFEGGF
jgi:hydrogenase maturation protein HypF